MITFAFSNYPKIPESMNFLDLFTSQLGPGQLDALSNTLGADKAQTSSALGTFVPLIVSAMARNTSNPTGAAALAGALDRDHDGSILTQLPQLLNNPALGNGDGILGHILGGKRQVAEQAVAQQSGLSAGSTSQLFTIVAPIVLGMIGGKKRQEGFGADILAGMLRSFSNTHEQQAPQNDAGGGLLGSIGGMVASSMAGNAGGNAGNAAPSSGMGSLITSILDRDGDGSAIDDVAGMLGNMLSGK